MLCHMKTATLVTRGIGRIMGALLLTGLVACSRSSETPVPATDRSDTAAPAVETGAVDLFSVMPSGRVTGFFVRKTWIGTMHGITLIIGPRTGGSSCCLALSNAGPQALVVRCPSRYVATLPRKKDSTADGPASESFFFVNDPAPRTCRLGPGESVEVPLTNGVYYIGDMAAIPPAPGGERSLFGLEPVADNSPLVKIAEFIAKTSPPPERVDLACALVADNTPTDAWDRVWLSIPYHTACALRDMLAALNLPQARHPGFDAADTFHRRLVEALDDGLKASPAVYPEGTMRGTDVFRFCSNDLVVAERASRYLQPDPVRREYAPLAADMALFHVRAPAVLDRLFQFALREGDLAARVDAALSLVQLGDVRGVPLVLQFLEDSGTDDTRAGAIRQAVVAYWQAQGQTVDERNLVEHWRSLGALASPAMAGVRPVDREALAALLASGRNRAASRFDELCRQATTAAESSERVTALSTLVNLAATPAQKERVFTLLLDRMAHGTDPQERYYPAVIIGEQFREFDSRQFEAACLRQLRVERNDMVQNGLFHALGGMKSEAAIPLLLPFLEAGNGSYASSALEQITGLKPSGHRRADWDTALRGKYGRPGPAPAATSNRPAIGDSREVVIRMLGRPRGEIKNGHMTTMLYPRGEVVLDNGKVTEVGLTE